MHAITILIIFFNLNIFIVKDVWYSNAKIYGYGPDSAKIIPRSGPRILYNTPLIQVGSERMWIQNHKTDYCCLGQSGKLTWLNINTTVDPGWQLGDHFNHSHLPGEDAMLVNVLNTTCRYMHEYCTNFLKLPRFKTFMPILIYMHWNIIGYPGK